MTEILGDAASGGLSSKDELVPFGMPGLDTILRGGLPRGYSYLVQGDHGSGKTTLGLQFCIEGARRGEPVLYLSTTEVEREVRQIARSHDWSLDGVDLRYLNVRETFGNQIDQSILEPSEVELPQTTEAMLEIIREVDPTRLVIDSLSEMRLLAAEPRWFRRQLLLLREALLPRACTTLFCGEVPKQDDAVLSIVHGSINLEQTLPEYGPSRRRLAVVKLRGKTYESGYHDFKIRTGGVEVYPRLVAASHRRRVEQSELSTGVPALDQQLGGGLDRSAAVLLIGPSGAGKSILASQFVVAAARRGERAAVYLFEESIDVVMKRSHGMGLPLESIVAEGQVQIQQVDPAEFTVGEFNCLIKQAVEEEGVRTVVIDSLSGYFHAMPGERTVMLHLQELLAFLSGSGVSAVMILPQNQPTESLPAGLSDLSHISDTVLRLHTFDYRGDVRKAISVFKRRGGPHEATLRELSLGSDGIRIGEPLRQFQGIIHGTPTFIGNELPDVPSQNRQ